VKLTAQTTAGPVSLFAAAWERVADFASLTKPGILALAVLTTAAGFLLATGGAADSAALAALLLGATLVGAGTNAWNHLLERDVDARMERTRRRPLPAGRLEARSALVFASCATGAGLAILALGTNLLVATLAVASFLLYAFVYTPLKRRSPLCTIVGAIPGALPPLFGWAAARGSLGAEAWTLFGILFFWQLPHFLAIAWLYREDYARAGFPMLPVVDEAAAGRQALLQTAALVLLSVAPPVARLAGGAYVLAALVLGGAFLSFAIAFARRPSPRRARALFLASIAYLPALLAFLVGGALSATA
jgi:protoheme IX farnesyltransferase